MPAPDYATEIAGLEKAMASGELIIESDGDRVQYRSRAELIAQLNYFRAQAQANSGAATPSVTVAAFSRS